MERSKKKRNCRTTQHRFRQYRPRTRTRKHDFLTSNVRELEKNKINILDTPGFDDFVGEVIANLKVADTALIMVNAAAGVEVGTELVWEYVEDYKTPSIFVINQMDHQKADYDAALEQLKNRFGSKVIPIQYPLNSGESFNQIVDALRMVMYEFPATGGNQRKTNPRI